MHIYTHTSLTSHPPTAARLHTEKESGFYTGRIEAVDLDRHQYWVTFDRPGLGKHSIPDTEIKVHVGISCSYLCIGQSHFVTFLATTRGDNQLLEFFKCVIIHHKWFYVHLTPYIFLIQRHPILSVCHKCHVAIEKMYGLTAVNVILSLTLFSLCSTLFSSLPLFPPFCLLFCITPQRRPVPQSTSVCQN